MALVESIDRTVLDWSENRVVLLHEQLATGLSQERAHLQSRDFDLPGIHGEAGSDQFDATSCRVQVGPAAVAGVRIPVPKECRRDLEGRHGEPVMLADRGEKHQATIALVAGRQSV